jgi:Na+-driven multidrug efflux pump
MAGAQHGIHRQVWAMAGPIILANVSVQVLAEFYTAVVGHVVVG